MDKNGLLIVLIGFHKHINTVLEAWCIVVEARLYDLNSTTLLSPN